MSIIGDMTRISELLLTFPFYVIATLRICRTLLYLMFFNILRLGDEELFSCKLRFSLTSFVLLGSASNELLLVLPFVCVRLDVGGVDKQDRRVQESSFDPLGEDAIKYSQRRPYPEGDGRSSSRTWRNGVPSHPPQDLKTNDMPC